MLDINLNLYKTFYVVAKTGRVTKASEKLHVTPPSVSTNISKLENLLNAQLFNRNNDGVTLTNAGNELFGHVDNALTTLGIGEKLVLQNNDLHTGKLTIGCPSHLTHFFLMHYIVDARKDYPDLQISFINGANSEDMLKLLEDHKIDFIIDTSDVYKEEHFTIEELKEVDNIFISKFPLKINDLKELQDLKYILNFNYTITTKRLIETLAKYDILIHPSIESDITEIRIEAVKKDLGIGYVMRQTVQEELEKNEIYEVQLPIKLPKSKINLIYIKGQLTKASKQFIKQYLK